jgi:hypothetical protein
MMVVKFRQQACPATANINRIAAIPSGIDPSPRDAVVGRPEGPLIFSGITVMVECAEH